MFNLLPRQYRIGNAAMGRILSTVMEMERQSMMRKEHFHDTIFAVYNRTVSADFEPDKGACINRAVYDKMAVEVDKAARRSAAARAAALRRKERREAERANNGYVYADPRPSSRPEGINRNSGYTAPDLPRRSPAYPPPSQYSREEERRQEMLVRDYINSLKRRGIID